MKMAKGRFILTIVHNELAIECTGCRRLGGSGGYFCMAAWHTNIVLEYTRIKIPALFLISLDTIVLPAGCALVSVG